MSDNLIYDINPLVISSIDFKRGRRIGDHPRKLRLLSMKNPIRAFFGFYDRPRINVDGFYFPYVAIRNSNREILLRIECRSNIRAKNLRNELNLKLNEFLERIKIYD
jgi:hypothetical protein